MDFKVPSKLNFNTDSTQAKSRPRSSAEIDQMVDQTVTMIESIQENLQEPTTNSALVLHPDVMVKREPNRQSTGRMKVENSDDGTEGSMENDANRAFIEDQSEEDTTPGNVLF